VRTFGVFTLKTEGRSDPPVRVRTGALAARRSRGRSCPLRVLTACVGQHRTPPRSCATAHANLLACRPLKQFARNSSRRRVKAAIGAARWATSREGFCHVFDHVFDLMQQSGRTTRKKRNDGPTSIEKALPDVIVIGQPTGVGLPQSLINLRDKAEAFNRVVDRGVVWKSLQRLYGPLLCRF